MTIKDWQKSVDDWITQYGVRYFDEMTNTLLLSEEVGEFSRHIARKYGEQSYKKPADREKSDEDIRSELGDILFVLTCLANQMDIDITQVLENNMTKKTHRDSKRHINNPKLSG